MLRKIFGSSADDQEAQLDAATASQLSNMLQFVEDTLGTSTPLAVSKAFIAYYAIRVKDAFLLSIVALAAARGVTASTAEVLGKTGLTMYPAIFAKASGFNMTALSLLGHCIYAKVGPESAGWSSKAFRQSYISYKKTIGGADSVEHFTSLAGKAKRSEVLRDVSQMAWSELDAKVSKDLVTIIKKGLSNLPVPEATQSNLKAVVIPALKGQIKPMTTQPAPVNAYPALMPPVAQQGYPSYYGQQQQYQGQQNMAFMDQPQSTYLSPRVSQMSSGPVPSSLSGSGTRPLGGFPPTKDAKSMPVEPLPPGAGFPPDFASYGLTGTTSEGKSITVTPLDLHNDRGIILNLISEPESLQELWKGVRNAQIHGEYLTQLQDMGSLIGVKLE